MDTTTPLHVTDHMGYAVTLNTGYRRFEVIVDEEGETLHSYTLTDLIERLEAYLKKVEIAKRQAQTPVTIAVLRQRDSRKGGGYECFSATILGINAREKYKLVLRAKVHGESEGIENSFHVRFLHPDDPRRKELAQLIKEQDSLQDQLTTLRKTIHTIGESCTTIKLRPSSNKEDVLENEPKLLEQLRAIVPLKENTL